MTMKTKTLSTLRQSSTMYPVKNSKAGRLVAVSGRLSAMRRLNAIARPNQTAHHASASFSETTWALRLKTPRSRASITATKARKPTHAHHGIVLNIAKRGVMIIGREPCEAAQTGASGELVEWVAAFPSQPCADRRKL